LHLLEYNLFSHELTMWLIYAFKLRTYRRHNFYGNLCENKNNYARELYKGILSYNYGHTSVEVLSDASEHIWE
jgi:hypothetical protein